MARRIKQLCIVSVLRVVVGMWRDLDCAEAFSEQAEIALKHIKYQIL